jgi:hypothetical protein
MATQVVKYDPESLKNEITSRSGVVKKAVVKINALTITCNADKQVAGRWLVEAKERKAELVEWRDSVVKPIFQAHRQASTGFKNLIAPFDVAIDLLNKKMVDWDREEEKRAREEADRIRREQEAEAEEERAAIQAEANEAEENGNLELAAELNERAEEASTVIPFVGKPAKATQVEGTRRRSTWKAEITDLDKVPMKFCKKVPDMAVLNALARKYQNKQNVEGVHFYEDVTYAKG